MPFKLSEHQKSNLLGLLSPIDPEHFFLNIEYMMETPFLPLKGKRGNVLKKQVTLLKEIAKSSRKLTNQLNQLDTYFLQHLNLKLGAAFDNHQPNELSGRTVSLSFTSSEPNNVTYPLSVKIAARTIEVEAEFEANSLEEEYGSSSVEWVLSSLYNTWEPNFPDITASSSSRFVKYIGIILEDDDLEKLSKQIQRSKWFASYKKYNRDKKRKK